MTAVTTEAGPFTCGGCAKPITRDNATSNGWRDDGDNFWCEDGELHAPAADADPKPLPERHPLVVWINAVNGDVKPRCFPDVISAYDAASTEYPFNNTRVTLGWCTEKHASAATAAGGAAS